MELLDAAAVARWLRDDLRLEDAAKAAEENPRASVICCRSDESKGL